MEKIKKLKLDFRETGSREEFLSAFSGDVNGNVVELEVTPALANGELLICAFLREGEPVETVAVPENRLVIPYKVLSDPGQYTAFFAVADMSSRLTAATTLTVNVGQDRIALSPGSSASGEQALISYLIEQIQRFAAECRDDIDGFGDRLQDAEDHVEQASADIAKVFSDLTNLSDTVAALQAMSGENVPMAAGAGCIKAIAGTTSACMDPQSHWVRIGNVVILNLGFYCYSGSDFVIGDLPFNASSDLFVAPLLHPNYQGTVSQTADGTVDLMQTSKGSRTLRVSRPTSASSRVLMGTLVYFTEDPMPATGWESVRQIVRQGLAPDMFPVGYEFDAEDPDTGRSMTWVVRAHDHHKAADDSLKHTMTLEMKHLYSTPTGAYQSMQFDAAEALYYAAEGLDAGTYHFTWDYATGSIESGTYQFTLTQPLPAGGQIVFSSSSTGSALTARTIASYASVGAAEAMESGIAITDGSDGTNLGTVNSTTSTDDNLNCGQRILFGSNNYAQSAIRQWLNSADAAGAVWSPANKFDRAPGWAAAYNGFMRNLPADFLTVVQPAVVPCRTNSVYEVASLDGTEFVPNQVYELKDKFFSLSRSEVAGDGNDDGEQLEYYNGLTGAERIKYDESGTARVCTLRTPNSNDAKNKMNVNATGEIRVNYSPDNAYGVAPACIIA